MIILAYTLDPEQAFKMSSQIWIKVLDTLNHLFLIFWLSADNINIYFGSKASISICQARFGSNLLTLQIIYPLTSCLSADNINIHFGYIASINKLSGLI